ncbi:aldolase/citrate lyase family protein [Amycolatopsis japonica]
MARINGLIDKLARKEIAFGTWVQSGDFAAARAAGDSSADFAFVDMEHTGFHFPDLGHTLQWMVSRRTAAQRPAPATPIVRTPPNASERNQWMTKQTLDYGAMGILLPQVMNADDVAAAVEAARYPLGPDGTGPQGVRGSLPFQAMRYWGMTSVPDYYEKADLWPLNEHGELLLLLLVENVAAWENIEELVAVPGVGGVVWGAGDGAVSMGIRTFDITDPRLTPYRRKVIAACKAAGVAVGTPAAGVAVGSPAPDIYEAIDEGFDFIGLGSWDPDLAAKARDYAASKAK